MDNQKHIHLRSTSRKWDHVLQFVSQHGWSLTGFCQIDEDLFYRIQGCVKCSQLYRLKRDTYKETLSRSK